MSTITTNLDKPDRKKIKRVLYTNVQEIGEFRVAEMRKIVVSVVVFNGNKLLHLHEWYFRKADQTWNPSNKGISIPTALPFEGVQNPMEALAIIVTNTMRRLHTIPIDNPDNYVYAKTKAERIEEKRKHVELLKQHAAKKQAKLDRHDANVAAHKAKQEAKEAKRKEEMLKDSRVKNVLLDPDKDLINMCDVGFVTSILDELIGGNKND